MTKLSGARLLIRGKDRSFEPMHKVIVIADGIGIAIQIVKFGGIFNPKLSRATATCVQFPHRRRVSVSQPDGRHGEGCSDGRV